MKKFLSIIAILLILCFAFAACDLSGITAEPSIQDTPLDEWEGPITDGPDPYEVDYGQIINQWLQYVSFSDNADEDTILSSSEFITDDNDINVSVYGYLLISTKTETMKSYIDAEATEPETVLTKKVTTVYDLRTESIREIYVSKRPATNADGIIDSTNYSVRDFVNYTIDAYDTYGIYRVEKTILVLREDFDTESGVEPTFNDYVQKSTYSYYNFDGDAILLDTETSDFEFRTTNNGASGRFLFDLEDKTYLMTQNDGEIIREFARGEEYDLPVYDTNAVTLTDGYTYFEAYDYKYVLTESQPITQKLGDLTMYTIPGMTVTVFDENYKVLVDYTTNCYHVAGYAVLGNGSLYVCEYDLLPSTATEFDFELADMKFNAVHKIVDPKSGTVEALELDFIASGLFNNVTTDIRSFTTITTANVDATSNSALAAFKSLLDTCSVNDGYTLAQVQKIAEGAIATESVFVVLDDNLNIVAELPKFMPNQIGYASFIDDGLMLVNVTATDNKTVSYMVDTKEGNASLFVHEYLGTDRVTLIRGGYYFNGVVYDNNWNAVFDLAKEGYAFQFVANDRIFYTEYNEESDLVLYYGYFSESYYDSSLYFSTDNYVCSGDTITRVGDYIAVYEQYNEQLDEYNYNTRWYIEYRNFNGETLMYSQDIENDYLNIDGETAYYNGSASVNVSAIGNGNYLVARSVIYTLKDTSGVSDENVSKFPTRYTITTYYIFK